MNTNAKLYITVFIVLGISVLGMAFSDWDLSDPVRFACYFLLAVTASVLKVAMPGMAGSMSLNFLFVLIGIVQLSLPETLLLGCASVVIECVWRPVARTTLLELFFSLANMAVAIACAQFVYSYPRLQILFPTAPLIAIATTAFYAANTFPMAAVVALSEHRRVWGVYRERYLESYPSYLAGAALAWAFHRATLYAGWQTALLVLPVTYLIFRTYRLYLARVDDRKVHAEQMANLHLRTIEALALAIEAKDNTTHDHLKRVQVYAMEVGKELKLTGEELEALQAAAVLHDIGKLAVPEHIISKPGRLTPEEFEKMKIHPVVGAEILEHVQFPYPVVPIVRAHHEKWNGTGYPYGLRGKDIPIGARILSAVDALDALASDRQYRRALPLDEAMSKVEQDSGRAFDPAVVEVLKRRYVELEKKASSANSTSVKLSTDLKIERGAAPAAGFEAARPAPVMEPGGPDPAEDFFDAAGAARRDVQTLFEGDESNSLEEVLARLSVRLKRLISFEAIAVYFVQQDKLFPRYVNGDNYRLFSSLRIPVGQGLSGWVAENRKPILNGNPSVEPGYLNNPNIFSTLRSAMAVPLVASSNVIGVLSFYHESRDAFTSDHLRLIQAIAPKLALSIEEFMTRQSQKDTEAEPAVPAPDAAVLMRNIDHELARAKRLNTSMALLVCSMENLASLSRRSGRAETESVIQSMTKAMRDGFREFDYLGRIGESEFVFVLPGLSAAAVKVRTAKLQAISADAGAGTLSLLVGEALYPEDGAEAEQLFAAADRRLFELRYRRLAATRQTSNAGASNWVQ